MLCTAIGVEMLGSSRACSFFPRILDGKHVHAAVHHTPYLCHGSCPADTCLPMLHTDVTDYFECQGFLAAEVRQIVFVTCLCPCDWAMLEILQLVSMR